MSIHVVRKGVYKIRWREGGRNKAETVHGPRTLADKIERKKLSLRDENRHLDIKKEVNFRMSALIERYREQYGNKKKSADREKAVLTRIGADLGKLWVREVDGKAVERWYQGLIEGGLKPGTAVRHFNVMHHMMEKAATIWSDETGIDRNPADLVEVYRPDDQRERYLSSDELLRLKRTLDEKMFRKGTGDWNRTYRKLRLVVLTALSTGMRESEIFALEWSDLRYHEGLIAVQVKLKGGKIRYVPMSPELAEEFRCYRLAIVEKRIFPAKRHATGNRQRVDRSFKNILRIAGIEEFRFHDLRHTFASWYMMNGGDLYELAKILGHSNIKMTERYAKLGRDHISRTGDTAQKMWKLMEGDSGNRKELAS